MTLIHDFEDSFHLLFFYFKTKKRDKLFQIKIEKKETYSVYEPSTL